MELRHLAYAVILAAAPASAQESVNGINLLHGHPIHHEALDRAGVAMGLSITGDQANKAPLDALCDQLRVAAGLRNEVRENLKLEALFIVPYKAMAVEGYYLPEDGDLENYALVPGIRLDRSVLDGIVARAGIPPSVLDEVSVEQEISCKTDEPLWTISWQDVRPVGDEEPEAVIECARERFMTIYQRVLERATTSGL